MYIFFLLGVQYVNNLGANHSAIIKPEFDKARYINLDFMQVPSYPKQRCLQTEIRAEVSYHTAVFRKDRLFPLLEHM